MEGKRLPFVSFVIPTYNAERYLPLCLASISRQQYAQDKIEIIIVDGGSNDSTLDIAKGFPVKVINNPDRIAEFGKSIGIQHAKGEYIIILDSDNEIVQKNWLLKNIAPLENDFSIVGMDSVFLVKKNDFLVNRYCALLGLEDPLVRYLADLASNACVENHPDYSVYSIKKGRFPIFGSNGFIWRKKIFEKIGGFIPRYDEAEFCVKIIENGFTKIGFVKDIGIYHHHLENLRQFIGKRIRRGKEFMSRKFMTKESKRVKSAVWLDRYSKWELLKSIFLCLTIVYPLYESTRGYLRDKDYAWFLHPFLCLITVCSYIYTFAVYNLSTGTSSAKLKSL